MDRAYAAGAIGTPPTAPGSPSIGYPTAGNPGGGVVATRPGPYWYHMVTEELRNLVTAAGLTPAQGTLTQVAAAVAALIAAGPIVPIGQIAWMPASTAPTGWIKANGALLSRTTYAALWAFAQASGNLAASDAAWTGNPGKFSPGDGSTTFRIPDLRGLVVRGHHDGSGTYETDTGRALGSYQADELESHNHITVEAGSWPYGSTTPNEVSGATYTALSQAQAYTSSTGGAETRGRNVSLLACIRY